MEISRYLCLSVTEEINEKTLDIDMASTQEMLYSINEEDQGVAFAVKKEIPQIARAVDMIYKQLWQGGRLFYIGAGTSGRLGVLDASECPPTYGCDPEMVQGIIAGGDMALRNAVEGAEDDEDAGARVVCERHVNARDVMVGITASGSTPYVLGAARACRENGAPVIGLVNNPHSPLEELSDICITPIVGAEVVVGSTRMKSGTATKMVLNMLSTAVMIKLGKVYGNLMVDLNASNCKLKDRAARMVSHIASLEYEIAVDYLERAGGDTKVAVMMAKTGLQREACERILHQENGILKRALTAALDLE